MALQMLKVVAIALLLIDTHPRSVLVLVIVSVYCRLWLSCLCATCPKSFSSKLFRT